MEYLDRREAAAVIGSDFYQGAQIDRRGVAINPLAWVRGLARAAISQGAALHERSRMTGLAAQGDGWRVTTEGGAIRAGQVLLCTNAYTDDAWPGLRRTIIPVRGYQVWTKPLPEALRGTLLRGVSAMNDTRRLLTGLRLYPDGRVQFSGGVGFGAERTPDLAERLRRIRAIFPELAAMEVEGPWERLGDPRHRRWLAPAPARTRAAQRHRLQRARRGEGPIMGRELARCAAGVPEEELLVPLSPPRGIAWYPLHPLLGAMALRV